MQARRWPEVVIAVLLLIALGCVGLAWRAQQLGTQHRGPNLLARASNGNVWLSLDQELLIASSGGKLLQQISLQELKLPGPITALTAYSQADQPVRMLAGAINLPEWLIFNEQGQVVQRLTPENLTLAPDTPFKLAADPDGRIAISNAADRQIALYNARGRPLAHSEPGGFGRPNGIWYEKGRWWVVDTTHNQVRGLNGDTLKTEKTTSIPAVGAARQPTQARRGRAPADSFTVIQLRQAQEYGTVIDVSSRGKRLREYRSRAARPRPADFLWLDDKLLLAERDDYSLELFGPDGQYAGIWGDEALNDAIQNAQRAKTWWLAVLRFAETATVVCGIAALVIYLARRHRRRKGSTGTRLDVMTEMPALEPGYADSLTSPGTSDEGEPALHHLAESPNATQASAARDEFCRMLATPSESRFNALITALELRWPLWSVLLAVYSLLLTGLIFLTPILEALRDLKETPWQGMLIDLISYGLPILTLTAIFVANRQTVSRSRHAHFEGLLSTPAVRWLQRSQLAHQTLAPGELPREVMMVRTGPFFPFGEKQIWLLSKPRLLIFRLGLFGGEQLKAEYPRSQAHLAVGRPKGWRRALGFGDKVWLKLADGNIISGHPASPVTARRLAELLDGTA